LTLISLTQCTPNLRMNTQQFIEHLKLESELKFSDFLDLIDRDYHFTDIAFENGSIFNSKDENQGSAKVFCFGYMHSLSEQETLKCFAEHYQSVLESIEDRHSHLNIRSFIENGWQGLVIDFDALTTKS